MNNQQIIQILEDYQRLLNKEEATLHGIELIEKYNRHYTDNQVSDFIFDLTEAGNKNHIIFLQSSISFEGLEAYLRDLLFPVLMFVREDDQWIPISIYATSPKKNRIVKYYGNESQELSQLPSENELLKTKSGEVLMLAAFQFDSLVSQEEGVGGVIRKLTPVQRLLRLLSTEKRDITYIYTYALIIGIITLVLPLAVQGIIGQIAGGVEVSTIYILIGLVIMAVLFNGGLQVMQLFILEMVQRRVFAKGSYEFAFRIPRLKIEALQKQYVPELINRFFDILTVQKGLPKLLMDISTSILQIIFGLILLSFYHSSFVFFGFFILIVLVLIFYITGPRGLETALYTSKYKYKVVYWLEELARALRSFKIAGSSSLPISRADYNLNHYLIYRHKHFKVLISQYILIVLFKTLVIGGLLIIGSLLVIDRQITLGQFVASELVVVIIVNSVEKIIMYMDTVYDLLTAVEKIGQVTDLPLEKGGGIDLPDKVITGGLYIKVRNLKYKYEDNDFNTLNGLDLDLQPGEKAVVTGANGSGKSTLVNILSGIYTEYKGVVCYNNISLKDINLISLRNKISLNISQEDIFEGTILENILVSGPDNNYHEAVEAAEKVKLIDFIQQLPNGFHTHVVGGGKNFSESINHKIILARCIIKKPKFLILHDFFNVFDDQEKEYLLKIVTQKADWTLLIVSNDSYVLSSIDKVYVMEKGTLREKEKN
jgi:ABC-type bacteriocin/lantibiotic exporter with double-glycine peptidase domain